MKAPVYSIQGEKKGEITLGKAFSTPVRIDIIRRAFRAESSTLRQAYGVDPLAGKRTSAHYHGKRHYRYTMMNREMSRMKRIHSQGFLNMTARFVPQATKGRKAHPPKAERNWKLKINKKERILALQAALSASVQKDVVFSKAPVPVVFEDGFQNLKKTKDVLVALKKVIPAEELAPKKNIRAGKGTRRGRKYRRKRGVLIILKEGRMPAPPGAEVKQMADLQVKDLAPGGDVGRLCIWTESSIQEAGNV